MRYQPREMEYTDLPSIHVADARYIAGVSVHTWRRQWHEVFQYQVKHWKTANGVRVNLESLIETFYPAAKDDAALRARMAHDYMWQLTEKRNSRLKATKLRKAKERAEDQAS